MTITRRRIRHWTREELQLLRRLWGERPTKEVAARLDRSRRSVQNKAREEKLRWEDCRASWYTAEDVARFLGVHHSAVQHWVTWGWLRATKTGKFLRIERAHLRRFLFEHITLLEEKRVDMFLFLEIVTGGVHPDTITRIERRREDEETTREGVAG